MLRKVTSFFDSSLGSFQSNARSFHKACALRDRLTLLIQQVSIIPNLCGAYGRAEDDTSLGKRLAECFADMGPGKHEGLSTAEFRMACHEVCRLECVFTYHWEKKPTESDIRQREMRLELNFYRKAEKTAFYKFRFRFTNVFPEVYTEHAGPWTETKK
jgi:hypothetical protein